MWTISLGSSEERPRHCLEMVQGLGSLGRLERISLDIQRDRSELLSVRKQSIPDSSALPVLCLDPILVQMTETCTLLREIEIGDFSPNLP